MSHIPNSAMPHAGPTETPQNSSGNRQASGEQESGLGLGARAGQIADYARENPKTAAAAGVAIVGAIAAAAIPLVRGRKGEETASSGTKSRQKKG